MIKVLVYTEIPSMGGVLTFTKTLSKSDPHLQQYGVKFVFCTDKNNPIRAEYPEGTHFLDIELEYLEYHDDIKNVVLRKIVHIIKRFPYEARRLLHSRKNKKIIREYLLAEKFDCVLGNSGGYVSTIVLPILKEAKKVGIPTRIFLSHSYPDYLIDKRLRSKIQPLYTDYILRRNATNIITVSNFGADRIREALGRADVKIDVIYNGVDVSGRTISPAKKNSVLFNGEPPQNCKIVGMVGNFMYEKGHIYFLKALKKVKELYSGGVLGIIIGAIYDANIYEECLSFIRKNDLEQNISIKTNIKNAQEYMDAFDVLLMPSFERENFAFVLIEAMLQGVPAVAFRTGGIPEAMEDHVTGELVDPYDSHGMAQKTVEMLCDEEKRRSYSENCIKRANTLFSGESMRKHYAEYIRNCVLEHAVGDA